MPLDAASHIRGCHERPDNARLRVGVPVPDIGWPKDLFANEINQRDLMAKYESPQRRAAPGRWPIHMAFADAVVTFRAIALQRSRQTHRASVKRPTR